MCTYGYCIFSYLHLHACVTLICDVCTRMQHGTEDLVHVWDTEIDVGMVSVLGDSSSMAGRAGGLIGGGVRSRRK